MQIIHYKNIDSTNNEASRLIEKINIENHSAVFTEYQTSGRGQQGNAWVSNRGENLLFSHIFFNPEILVEDFFTINCFVSLALVEYLKNKGIKAKIKWPNDIYCGHNKIAGILIENTFEGSKIKVSIIGIGLNLNQTSFPAFKPCATSIKLITGIHLSPVNELPEIQSLLIKYAGLKKDLLQSLYLDNLYGINQVLSFSDGIQKFDAQNMGVLSDGRLILKMTDNSLRYFMFKEVYWNLPE